MSVDFHRHCQATVLSANGTDEQNGLSWTYINKLKDSLGNLPENWIEEFKVNKENITQDLASILKLLNSTVDNYLPITGGNMIGDIILPGPAGENNRAATKGYVDSMLGQNSGGTITGISMNGTSKGTDGNIDLGYVVSRIKVNGDIKTPDSNGLVDVGEFSVTNTDNNGTIISRINYDGKSYYIKMASSGGDIGGGSGGEGEGNVIFMNNPVGTIIAWIGNTSNTPDGYLVCDGSEVSQTDYPELYSVIGDKFGTSSEEGKFKLPNLVDGTYLQGNMNSGKYMDAGLPSISGKLTGTTNRAGEHTHAYTKINTYSPEVKNSGKKDLMIYSVSSSAATGSAGNHSHTINCDFSVEGGVYGKSDTVTPKSMTVIYLICSKVIDTNGNTNNDLNSVFDLIYPVGSIYLDANNLDTCPMESVITGSSWQKLGNKLLTGDSKAPVIGNGTDVGVMNISNGDKHSIGLAVTNSKVNVGQSTTDYSIPSINYRAGGLTTDPEKSGMVADIGSANGVMVNIWKRIS